jgi:hypothetical protein
VALLPGAPFLCSLSAEIEIPLSTARVRPDLGLGGGRWRFELGAPPASSPTAARDGEEQHAEEGGGDASRAVWRG